MDRIENFLLETRINYLLDNGQWDFLKEIAEGKYSIIASEGVSGLNYIKKENINPIGNEYTLNEGDTVIAKKDIELFSFYVPHGAIGIVEEINNNSIIITFSFPSYFGMNTAKLYFKDKGLFYEYVTEYNEEKFRVEEKGWLL